MSETKNGNSVPEEKDTRKYRTRQELKAPMTNPKGKDYIIGLDLGYSATKCVYETGRFCFPSYAKRIDDDTLTGSDENDILYRGDDDGALYLVGRNAQDIIESSDTNDTEGELYSRKRYSDERFKVICDVAVAIATAEKKDGRTTVIQTGLPTSFVRGDSEALKQVLSRNASFSMKIGNGPWKHYTNAVKKENIYIMPQPAGALYSVITKNDGNFTQDAKKLLSDNVVVLDIGFGTFDFYGIKNRAIETADTINDIGMHEVMSNASKRIMEEYGEDIRVAAIQQNLESGTVECFDDEEMKSESRPLAPILSAASREVMQAAFQRARSVTKSFRGYHYVIVDGGTGEAWYKDICSWLSGMKTLKIIPSNWNDHLPFIYSNARGYYMFRRQQKR